VEPPELFGSQSPRLTGSGIDTVLVISGMVAGF